MIMTGTTTNWSAGMKRRRRSTTRPVKPSSIANFRSRQMDNFIQELREQELIKEFDARLWGSLVDFITVYSKDDIRVTFKDGTEIKA